MAKLIYSAITSLDGYIADQKGKFDWSVPDEEVHAAVNDLERTIGTYLYGRRMYEVMAAWETMHLEPGQSDVTQDFARIWQSADKVVFSGTLGAASSERTRIECTFEPEAIDRLKRTADRDISIGGPTVAAAAFRAGLVDECHLFVSPIVVGGGNQALPDRVRV